MEDLMEGLHKVRQKDGPVERVAHAAFSLNPFFRK